MFNVIYANNGTPPKRITLIGRIALVEFIINTSPTYVNINGMDLNWEELKRNKKVNRYLKLRRLNKIDEK